MIRRRRATWPVALALLVTFSATVQSGEIAPAGVNTPVTLDQIMTAVRTVRHVNARYVEHRYLHILNKPIESRGTLRFDAPDRLEKKADPASNGAAEQLTIDGDRLTIDRGTGAQPVVIALHEHPEIGVLAESIRATLSGDGAALQRTFEVTPSGSLDHWQLVLQPRDPAERKLLQWMRVIGYGERITEIDTADGEGDRSEMSIVEQSP
jgi:Outer membrane lipoprotein carrier protein LolA-like